MLFLTDVHIVDMRLRCRNKYNVVRLFYPKLLTIENILFTFIGKALGKACEFTFRYPIR